MLSTVKDIPKVQDMISKAKTILGWDVLELCLGGPEAKLEETKYCQPAMFVAGLAGVEKLRGEREEADAQPGFGGSFARRVHCALSRWCF